MSARQTFIHVVGSSNTAWEAQRTGEHAPNCEWRWNTSGNTHRQAGTEETHHHVTTTACTVNTRAWPTKKDSGVNKEALCSSPFFLTASTGLFKHMSLQIVHDLWHDANNSLQTCTSCTTMFYVFTVLLVGSTLLPHERVEEVVLATRQHSSFCGCTRDLLIVNVVWGVDEVEE